MLFVDSSVISCHSASWEMTELVYILSLRKEKLFIYFLLVTQHETTVVIPCVCLFVVV